ncbi:MAG: hypothetical protein KGN01_06715, partial [Patescibacteria group bacterium]|nr:hypothetical protein [Patescibacteria group bacterium]
MAKESTGWKKQAKQEMQERAMGRYYKVTPGAHTLRILPNKKGVDYPPFLIVRVHRNVGPNKAFIRCGKKAKSGEGSCWLCDKKIPQLEASSKKSLLQKAKEMV